MRRDIVSNSGPIIALASVGRLDLLNVLFNNIYIPERVKIEILEGGAAGLGVVEFETAEWIQVKKATGATDPLLESMLHAGEARA